MNEYQSELLSAPFGVLEHEIKNLGGQMRTYVKEFAIIQRLRMVDPGFSVLLKRVWTENTPVLVAHAEVCVSVLGQQYEGIGSQEYVTGSKDGQMRLYNEPLKAAATDALKRAARLAGIGGYLTEIGVTTDHAGNKINVTDYESLKLFLRSIFGSEYGMIRSAFTHTLRRKSGEIVLVAEGEKRREIVIPATYVYAPQLVAQLGEIGYDEVVENPGYLFYTLGENKAIRPLKIAR